jgi:hypothetical protein
MSSEDDPFSPMTIVCLILCLASCIHVFLDSKHDLHIGHPWMHSIMCAILWPLPYVLWLFLWPGKLRQAIFGSDRDRISRKFAKGRITNEAECISELDSAHDQLDAADQLRRRIARESAEKAVGCGAGQVEHRSPSGK